MSPSLPTAYLDAYPLPAFVVAVTAIGHGPGQSQSQAQRYAQNHRQSKRGSVGSNNSSLSGSWDDELGAPLSKLNLDALTGGSATPTQHHPDLNGEESTPSTERVNPISPPLDDTYDTDFNLSASPNTTGARRSKFRDGFSRHSGKSRAYSKSSKLSDSHSGPTSMSTRLTVSDQVREAAEALLVEKETRDHIAPLPNFHHEAQPPRVQILCSNDEWRKLAGTMSLSDLVQPSVLAAFAAWIEAQEEDVSDVVAYASAAFGLELQSCNGVGMMMDVIKTRHAGGTGLVIVTATRLHVSKPRPPALELPKAIQRNLSKPAGKTTSPTKSSSPVSAATPNDAVVSKAGQNEPVPLCSTLLEETDWCETSLGPRDSWSVEVKFMVDLVFSSINQDAVWVGPDMIMIYNQAFASLVDHPRAFGRPAKEVWCKVWDEIGPSAQRALSGEQVYRPNGLLLFKEQPNGYPIETYHSYSLMPLFDSERNVIALWNPTTDHTAQVIAERRLETTRMLVEEVAWARSRHEFFDTAADVIATNPVDAPFAAFYSATVRDPLPGAENKGTVLVRAGTVGIPFGHPHIPAKVVLTPAVTRAADAATAAAEGSGGSNVPSLRSRASTFSSESHRSSSIRSGGASGNPFQQASTHHSTTSLPSSHPSHSSRPRSAWSKTSSSHHGADGLAIPFARAIESRQCVLIEDSHQLFSGVPVRQWDSPPELAIVIPLNLESATASPPAVLLLGLNLYRPLDIEYEEWIQQIRGQLASGLSSVIAFEEEVMHRADKERLERAKEAWFRGAANEFRTPLSLIAGPLDDILHSHKLDGVLRKQLTIAYRNTRKLQQLMTSLFDFTRLEAGRVTARFMPVDLREFVNDIGAIFKAPIDKLGRVRFRIKAEEHDKVCVDPVLLEIVVSHLIVNALKYTEHGTITLSLKFTNNAALISVLDTGLGIPEADFEAVTDVFHRSETVNNRGTEGTGMGLALVKEIVRLHEGTLTIKSQTLDGDNLIPRGSRFTASIPLDHVADVDNPITSFGVYARQVAECVTQWSRERTSASSDSEASAGTGRSLGSRSEPDSVSSGFRDGLMFQKTDVLLIVDTDKDMLDFLRTMFEPFCTVIVAQTSTEAIELAKTTPPNLIISELLIRPLNGVELLTELRLSQELRHVPMVLLSYSTDDEQRMAAFVAGADDFLSKPFKPRELLLRVHLHMQMGKRRSMLEKLFAEREQELVVLTDSCPSGILRTDAEGQLVYANDSFREPAGIPPEEDLDTWLSYCDEETQQALAPVWLEILTGDEVKTNLQWKWRTGKTMSGVFIRLDKIRPGMSGIIACVTDISYQEEKLLDANNRRMEAEESKHQQELLVDLTSHEIRTPVSAILQCSSLVKENLVALKEQLRFAGGEGFQPSPKLLADLEEDVEALESIYQCGLVQERIAGDVLSLTRIQLDMLTVYDVEMDIRHEARKVLSVFSSEAKMKKIDIELELGESLDVLGISSIKTDPVRLGQVVTNLTANAIRFTATSVNRKILVRYDVGLAEPELSTLVNGSPPPTHPVPARRASVPAVIDAQTAAKLPLPLKEDTPVYLFVSVTDTGPGMMPQEKNVLFQRFHQGNRMIHTQYGGSGLGLFICKKITELLGGRIKVQSEVGVGSTFSFHILARTANPIVPKLENASPVRVPINSPPPAKLEMEAYNVLIVEDNAINQIALKRQLSKAGLHCDTANNGKEALVAIHEANRQSRHTEAALAGYDVILMDLEMPVMDGLTAVRHIREAEANGALRPQLVIALTGNARQAQIDQAKEAGMDDVIIKPYRLAGLLAKIKEKVEERREEHRESKR